MDEQKGLVMLTIHGKRQRFCDGTSRRTFLRIGTLGGLALPELLRAEAASGGGRSHKAVLMVYLPGGPSHIDMYDPKPAAPVEFRGDFRPIATRLPGAHICEHLPRLAALADKLVLLRSVVGAVDEHSSHICLTGWPLQDLQPAGGWPSFGSVVSRLQGAVTRAVPPFIGVSAKMEHHPYNDPGPGFLGTGHALYPAHGEGRRDLVLQGMTLGRLGDRRGLLASFDRFRRQLDASGTASSLDSFQEQALGVLTSSRLAEALDLDKEDPRVRDRYGKGDPRVEPTLKAAPRMTEHLLLARRLIEAGARCVSVAFGAWDWHEKNFINLKSDLPFFDRGMAALVQDLHERGLERDVTVLAWGDFGRNPRINHLAGRDHWPAVAGALLAGGGLRAGQVIGSTNRFGESPKDRPVHVREVLATLYHNLGLDITRATFPDLAGRPRRLIEEHRPIRELIS